MDALHNLMLVCARKNSQPVSIFRNQAVISYHEFVAIKLSQESSRVLKAKEDYVAWTC